MNIDPAEKLPSETWAEYSMREDLFSPNFEFPSPQFFKLPAPSLLEPACHYDRPSSLDAVDTQEKEMPANTAAHNSDLRSVLLNLSFLEQKIHLLQDFVKLSEENASQQHQFVMADISSIVVQLISTAETLLPSVKNSLVEIPVFGQGQIASGAGFSGSNFKERVINNGADMGSYEVLELEKDEILAPHAHFCSICSKGFKRNANLRMHMRGHGDEYKTIAALTNPSKEPGVLTKRFSCPYAGCKSNKDHINFKPLKTMLCVKNHYKRAHCDKSYTCSRCNRKKFSVLADLKTHEKHCGRGKWLCSCGTTFSRKDKLFGHVALFQGHTPAIPVQESKRSCVPVNGGENNDQSKLRGAHNGIDLKENFDGNIPATFFSSLDFDRPNLDGFHDFPLLPFDI